jgi:hypothetical protein
MTLALDGSVHGNSGGASSLAVSLTTTQANDYIIVSITTNSGPVVSVVSGAIGLFTRVGSAAVTGNPTFVMEVWAGFSPGALTADTITVTTTGSAFLTVDAFGVSGSGQTSLVFDVGGPQTGIVDPISITTASANTMVIASYRENSAASPTAGSGFTTISGANFQLTEYKVLSAGATTSCTQTTGAGTANAGVVFAIAQYDPIATGGARVLQRFNKSKLAYPAGALPRFDPSHPASAGISGGYGISAVANDGNFIDLTTGRMGVPTGAPTANIKSSMGPGVLYGANSDGTDFASKLTSLPNGMTLAAIAQPNIVGSAYQSLIAADAGPANGLLNISPTGALQIYLSGNNNSTIIPAANTPYFFAASTKGGVYNFVALNLRTGEVQTSSISGGTSIVGTNGIYRIGQNNGSQGFNGTIAAAMYAPTYMSMQQLLDWSKAPWEFWYPNKTINLASTAAVVTPPVTTGGARVSQRFNRSKLAYPAGALPGFDPRHPASAGAGQGISVVPSSGNMIDLMTGRVGAPTGFIKTNIRSLLGPAPVYSATGDYQDFMRVAVATPPAKTFAAIAQLDTLTGNYQGIICDGVSGGGLFAIGPAGHLMVYAAGNNLSAIFPAVGTPYFLAVSTAGGVYNFVAVNLRTGVVQTYQILGGTAIAAYDTTWRVGDHSGSQGFSGTIAAAMYSQIFLSMPKLAAWAADPWSFWFPNKPINLMSDGGVIVPPPTFLAAWARRSNPPVLGTGNF